MIPSGAEVWINGRLVGTTPDKLKDIKPGKHFVTLKKGDLIHGERVEITSKKKTLLRATLQKNVKSSDPSTALAEGLSSGLIDDEIKGLMATLAERTATDHVAAVLVIPVDDQLRVLPLLYSHQMGALRRLDPVDFDKDLVNVNVDGYALARNINKGIQDTDQGALILEPYDASPKAKVVAVIEPVVRNGGDGNVGVGNGGDGNVGVGNGGDGNVGVGNGGDVGNGGEDGDPWYTNAWLWTGVGVGVAAIVITSVLLTTGDEGASPATGFNATIVW